MKERSVRENFGEVCLKIGVACEFDENNSDGQWRCNGLDYKLSIKSPE